MANGGDFVPNGKYSSPTITSQITLHTEQSKRVFNRCFEGASRSLFSVDVIARALADTSKGFDHGGTMDAINGMISTIEKDIVNAGGRFKIMLKDNNHENTRPDYNNKGEFTFTISTPEILRFAKLLQAFDEMLMMFDTCWLTGLIESNKAQAFRTEKMRMVMRLVRKLQQQATVARKAFQRNENRDQMVQELGDLSGLTAEDDAERSAVEETNRYEDQKETAAA